MAFPTTTYLGTDTSCLTDLSTIDVLVSNNTMLAQRLMRRLTTPQGAMSIIDIDPSAAISMDINQYINAAIDSQTIISIQSNVTTICLSDEEVLDCTTQVIPPDKNRILIINISCTSSNGPFSLTLSVDQLNSQILYEVNG